jgi:peptide deformylase
MSKLDHVLLLGNPRLYELSRPVTDEEMPDIKPVINDLRDILVEFKELYNAGRGIAAPQIGILKRVIFLYLEEPHALINPILFDKSEEMVEIWDDCMCFPMLEVKVLRHATCKVRFRDRYWQEHVWDLKDGMAELLQHETDHLDGVLATQRAIDDRSFRWKKASPPRS